MNIISKGIDISRWQGDFNLEKAKAEGFEFAIIKGGGGDDGLYVDKRFAENYQKAKKLGMPVGIYWFSRALTVEKAVEEAEYFYQNCLKGRQFELPVYMDVENEAQLDLGKRKLTDVIHAWCQHLEAKNFWVGIYSSKSYFSNYMIDSELQRYAHWVAAWSKSCSYSGNCFGMWQYGGETNLIRSNKVAGVVCDQNYMLVDYPAKIKAAGLNGFRAAGIEITSPSSKEPEVTPVGKDPATAATDVIADLRKAGYTNHQIYQIGKAVKNDVYDAYIDDMAKLVIGGEYGNGEERKQKLAAEGHPFAVIQTRVNKILAG